MIRFLSFHLFPLAALGMAACLAAAPPPFRDVKLPIDRRVDDLLQRLTVEEKIGQMMMASPAIPRLGIPAYDWWNEALHGVARAGEATVFPQAIALAAAWDPRQHERIATAISTEARAKHHEFIRQNNGESKRYQGLTIWSPNINIFRDPRWGRGHETYGEDPFLTGQLANAFVRGLQGNDPRHLKTVATVKHYAVHSGPESSRHTFNAVIPERDLRDTYLPAFETSIRDARAMSLMSAYNAVGGIPVPASHKLLDDILRREWGFEGAVVGDVDNVRNIFNTHKFARDAAEASALAVKAGNDLCSGTTYQALPAALERGLVSVADLDVALRRLFKLRFMLGMFDPPENVAWAAIPPTANCQPGHQQLALEAARDSLVLLKNDGVLPWNPQQVKTLAVLGPTADRMAALLGNYAGTPQRPVTLLDGLRRKFEPLGTRILHETGVSLAKGFFDDSEPLRPAEMHTDSSRATSGMKVEVFHNLHFEGAPAATFTDTVLDHRWNEYEPHPYFPPTRGSVRWSCVLTPPLDGEYVLVFDILGGLRVLLDDKVVFDRNGDLIRDITRVPLQLKAGKPARLVIEVSQRHQWGKMVLSWRRPDHAGRMDRALAAAAAADHIVLALGLTPELEGEEMNIHAEGFHGGDRTSIQLPAPQRELLEKVAALGKPVVLVLTGGSSIGFDPAMANAVLLAWYYGQSGGDAVAEALCGGFSPAGRLPITFYRNDGDLPPFEDYRMQAPPGRTYRYFTGKPLFPFGHGLSYTGFRYGAPSASPASADPAGEVTVRVPVSNQGKMASDEVVQVYARAPQGEASQPLKRLVGFQRLAIQPGETRGVEIAVPVSRLRHWDEAKSAYVVAPGEWELQIGASSADIRGTCKLTVSPASP